MERLPVDEKAPYLPIELAIHAGRYAPLLQWCKGKRVLDISCGEGYGSRLMNLAGAASVDGVDISAEAIGVARRMFQAPNLTYSVVDAHSVASWASGRKFDVIVSIETIEHLAQPESVLKQLHAIAESGAVIFITCPNDEFYYGDGEGNPYHVRRYSLAEFQALTTEALGGTAQWYIGTAVQGFAAVPISRAATRQGSRYVDVEPMASVLLGKPADDDDVNPRSCSYFVGVWNAPGPVPGGALFPLSMQRYALREQAAALHEQVIGQIQRIFDLEKAASEARHTKAALDRELVASRVLSSVLRRENDVLADSISRQRGEIAGLKHDTARLEDEIARLNDERASIEVRSAIQQDQLVRLRADLEIWANRRRRVIGLMPPFLRPVGRRLLTWVRARRASAR